MQLNGILEVNRLLTFNLALTFLEVSGGFVKEPVEAFRALGWVSKGGGSGDSRLLPVGLTRGSQNTKASVNLEKGLGTLVGRPEAPWLGRGLGAELPGSLGFCV